MSFPWFTFLLSSCLFSSFGSFGSFGSCYSLEVDPPQQWRRKEEEGHYKGNVALFPILLLGKESLQEYTASRNNQQEPEKLTISQESHTKSEESYRNNSKNSKEISEKIQVDLKSFQSIWNQVDPTPNRKNLIEQIHKNPKESWIHSKNSKEISEKIQVDLKSFQSIWNQAFEIFKMFTLNL